MKKKLKHLFMLGLFGMISIGASAEEIPNDEIWYTSSDGAVITPQGTIDFGANIISNTYANGKGIIKYDGNVTSIGYQAFYYCSRLTSVTIPNSVTSIGNHAFFYCSGLTSVAIPNSVTSIGDDAFSYCSGLTSVTIPNSVIEIGDGAFYECSGLRSVTIGNSLERIGSHAFDYCRKLTSVTIPNSVTEIGGRAFYFCSGLTSVTIPNSVTSIGSEAFSDCSGLASIKVESGNTVYDSRDNCNAIIETASNRLISGCKNTIIPNSVTSIGSSAFSRCSGLTSVTIPNSVTSIGNYAYYCSGLTSVTIPNSVTEIGKSAFSGCSELKSVSTKWTSEDAIPSIDSDCFPFNTCDLYVPVKTFDIYKNKNYWKNFRNIIPNIFLNNVIWYEASEKLKSVTSSVEDGLHTNAFNAKVKSHTFVKLYAYSNGQGCITFDADLTEIGNYAFYGSSNLTRIEIPSSVKSIGYSAFQNCKGLEDMIIPYSVTSIDEYAFYNCSSMTYLEIGSSVNYIDKTAFSSCSSLTNVSVAYGNTVYDSRDNCNAIIKTSSNTLIRGCKKTTIPNSVTSIGDNAFSGCNVLTSITIPTSVESVGKGAFEGCTGLKSVNITDLDKWAEIEFGDGSANPISSNNRSLYLNGQLVTKVNLKTAKKVGALAFNSYENLVSVNIPNSVTSIGRSAFGRCSGLTSVTIPNSVTSIGESAFAWCTGLTSVTIPNSVTSIGEGVFEYCRGLTSVTIPNSVIKIGDCAFRGCSGMTSVTIPNSVTSIGDSAFDGCSGLTSVTIPNSVTYIDDDAFRGCSGLGSVYVGWNELSKIASITSNAFPFSACNLYVPYGTTSIYKSKNYWKNFKSIIEPSGQTVTISAAKYGTFASRYATKIPEGVSAYKATVDGSTVTMTKIQDGVIPGECGVILYAAQGSYTFAPYTEVEQIEGNQLVAVTDRTYTCTGEDVGKVYYLGLDNGGKANFVCLNENGTIPVGKAYLKIDEPIEAGAKLDVVFEDTPTGIQTIDNGQLTIDNFKAYNLNGVRVNANYKGIIIMNGKKYMNR